MRGMIAILLTLVATSASASQYDLAIFPHPFAPTDSELLSGNTFSDPDSTMGFSDPGGTTPQGLDIYYIPRDWESDCDDTSDDPNQDRDSYLQAWSVALEVDDDLIVDYVSIGAIGEMALCAGAATSGIEFTTPSLVTSSGARIGKSVWEFEAKHTGDLVDGFDPFCVDDETAVEDPHWLGQLDVSYDTSSNLPVGTHTRHVYIADFGDFSPEMRFQEREDGDNNEYTYWDGCILDDADYWTGSETADHIEVTIEILPNRATPIVRMSWGGAKRQFQGVTP